MSTFKNIQGGSLLAAIAASLLFVGCDAFSGIVPQADSGQKTETADRGDSTPSNSAAADRHPSGPSSMGMPPSGEGQMAEMMAGGGEMAIPGGAPDEMDMTDEFASQFGTAIPDDGPQGSGVDTDEYFSNGAALTDPAVGSGAPGEFDDATEGYLETVNGGAGALFNPDDYDVHGNYVGKGAVKTSGNVASRSAKTGGPADGKTPAPAGRESILRNKNPRARPVSQPTRPPTGSSGGTAPSTKKDPPALFSEQPLFRLSNPVALFDGTGFSIGFSVDYQLLRAPENGVTYYWAITFQELSKSGRGSEIRKVQQAFRPTDSSTLKVVIPLKGQPKEPYRCAIVGKKGDKVSQVSRMTTFPPTSK